MNYAFTEIYEGKRIFIQILTIEFPPPVVRGTGPFYEGFRLRAPCVSHSL